MKPAGIHTMLQIPDTNSVFCNGHDSSVAPVEGGKGSEWDQRTTLGRSESQAISNIRESSQECEGHRSECLVVLNELQVL